VVSPPGCGKTTLLRDIIRQLSNGATCLAPDGKKISLPGRKVGIVDERSEVAACYHGVPQNDLGIRTDVLDGCPKSTGVELLLRSMSEDVIAMDELGGEEDIAVVKKSIFCGCKILATAHGEDKKEWFEQGGKEAKVSDLPFERYVFLKSDGPPGQVSAVCDAKGRVLFAENTEGWFGGERT